VHALLSLGQLQRLAHERVSKVQLEKHFKVPLYPDPKTPAHVAPPKTVPSHFSVPSRILFPQLEEQSLSVVELHPLGQHPSLFAQAVIVERMHLQFTHFTGLQESKYPEQSELEAQSQGAMHELVLNWQLEHFNVPVYPVPKTLAQVEPPKAVPSHFSVDSIIPFPQTATQLLSLSILQPLPAGQHPSLFIQEFTVECEHTPFEHESVVQAILSLHCPTVLHEVQPEIVVCEQTPLEQLSVVQALLSLQFEAEVHEVQPAIPI
jgi:hypothetical protein